jgi:lipopolysaccharide transport system ATP-binding protein
MIRPHIVGRGVVVEFPIFDNAHRSFKKAFMRTTTGGYVAQDAGNYMVVRALDHLDFDFREGDRIGLVGHNGSGKTTLLRVLSGVFEPVRGFLEVEGRVNSILDLSMGFDPDATGFENIFLRGVMTGRRRREIAGQIDEIAEFSELGDYLSLPVRTYSSGMLLRLAFAISTCTEAEILLLDEWLTVGDAEFSAKASQRLDDVANRASIIVVASHDPLLIERVCNRVLRLEHGIIAEDTVIQKTTSVPDPAQALEESL